MKNAGKARSYGLYRHLRTSKEIIENLLNYSVQTYRFYLCFGNQLLLQKYYIILLSIFTYTGLYTMLFKYVFVVFFLFVAISALTM